MPTEYFISRIFRKILIPLHGPAKINHGPSIIYFLSITGVRLALGNTLVAEFVTAELVDRALHKTRLSVFYRPFFVKHNDSADPYIRSAASPRNRSPPHEPIYFDIVNSLLFYFSLFFFYYFLNFIHHSYS